MLHYKTKNVNGKRVREPQWRKERFTRCRGMVDAVLAKNRFVMAERMEGGYFAKRQRELAVFEAAVEAYLLETAGEKLQDYRAACAMGSEEPPKAAAGAMPSGLTTGQMRRFRQQAAQASARRDKIAEARAKRARQAASCRPWHRRQSSRSWRRRPRPTWSLPGTPRPPASVWWNVRSRRWNALFRRKSS